MSDDDNGDAMMRWNMCRKTAAVLTQQQAVTVIWIVLRPARQTSFSGKGRWRKRWSGGAPGGPGLWIMSGVALTLTATEMGQLVAICESSWWKHFNCSSRSGLHV